MKISLLSITVGMACNVILYSSLPNCKINLQLMPINHFFIFFGFFLFDNKDLSSEVERAIFCLN